jgi:hypothetical protein
VDRLVQVSKTMHIPPMTIGVLYEQGGDYDKGLDWYEIAYRRDNYGGRCR